MRSKILVLAAASLFVASCGYQSKPDTDHSEDKIIGTILSSVSSLVSENGADNSKIAMYDATVCRIHQFDMSTGKWERTLTPRVPTGNHKVMFDPNGNYVIDVVDARLGIFNKEGFLQDPGVQFVGAPKNASFRPSLGYLVMQDDSKTAALVTINNLGNVSGTVSLGQIIHDDVSMVAGDIDDFGNLIVAQTDGKIAVINIAQTIATGDWVVTSEFASGLTGQINWLAPMHDGSRQILVKTEENSTTGTTIAIFDTQTGSQVGSSYVVPTSRKVIKTSKLYDPHFIVRDDVYGDSAASTVVYVAGSVIRTKTISNPIRNVLSSRLSVSGNSWTIVDTDIWKIWDPFTRNWYGRIVFDDYNIVLQNRLLQKFSLNSMTPLQKYKIPDTTQVQLGENKIFQLFPAKLGWARNTSISNPSDVKDINKFNAPFLHTDTCK